MILFSQFGYASRHSMKYNPKSKPGNLRLWSSYNGSIGSADPIENGEDSFLELLSHQFNRPNIFGSTIYLDLSIGADDDIFLILVAVLMIREGKDYSFKNYAGRLVTFSRTKIGKNNYDIVLVNVRHKDNTGIITLKELDELEAVVRNILANLGYSNEEISNKVNRIVNQSLVQDDKK
ncbi:MAG: hypothetical protein H7Y59_08710 [Anaerolineales bacterium]|nr:hypothetical protein [Anaerolineales bacterium]